PPPGTARNLWGGPARGHFFCPPFQRLGKPWPMLGAVDFGVSDHRQRASAEQRAQVSVALFRDVAELSLPPLEFCFGTSPTQAEKSRPDRNAPGSAMLATSAVASAGPTPGTASN